MYWVIRWTDSQTNEDKAMVVEAETKAFAERVALKRGIPVAFLGEAGSETVAAAKAAKMLWRYTPEPGYYAFGRKLTVRHVGCLMLCGAWTIVALLKVSHVPVILPLPF